MNDDELEMLRRVFGGLGGALASPAGPLPEFGGRATAVMPQNAPRVGAVFPPGAVLPPVRNLEQEEWNGRWDVARQNAEAAVRRQEGSPGEVTRGDRTGHPGAARGSGGLTPDEIANLGDVRGITTPIATQQATGPISMPMNTPAPGMAAFDPRNSPFAVEMAQNNNTLMSAPRTPRHGERNGYRDHSEGFGRWVDQGERTAPVTTPLANYNPRTGYLDYGPGRGQEPGFDNPVRQQFDLMNSVNERERQNNIILQRIGLPVAPAGSTLASTFGPTLNRLSEQERNALNYGQEFGINGQPGNQQRQNDTVYGLPSPTAGAIVGGLAGPIRTGGSIANAGQDTATRALMATNTPRTEDVQTDAIAEQELRQFAAARGITNEATAYEQLTRQNPNFRGSRRMRTTYQQLPPTGDQTTDTTQRPPPPLTPAQIVSRAFELGNQRIPTEAVAGSATPARRTPAQAQDAYHRAITTILESIPDDNVLRENWPEIQRRLLAEYGGEDLLDPWLQQPDTVSNAFGEAGRRRDQIARLRRVFPGTIRSSPISPFSPGLSWWQRPGAALSYPFSLWQEQSRE